MKTLKEEFELIIKALEQESIEYKEIRQRITDILIVFNKINDQFLNNNKQLLLNSDSLNTSSELLISSLSNFENKTEKIFNDLLELINERLSRLFEEQENHDKKVNHCLQEIETNFMLFKGEANDIINEYTDKAFELQKEQDLVISKGLSNIEKAHFILKSKLNDLIEEKTEKVFDGLVKLINEHLSHLSEVQENQNKKNNQCLQEIETNFMLFKSEANDLINEYTDKAIELQKEQDITISKGLSNIENGCLVLKSEILDLIDLKTDTIRKENKNFYKDLEDTIRIKLEEHKSEIKRLIEDERVFIKEMFVLELTKRTNELKNHFESEIVKRTKLIESEIHQQSIILAERYKTTKLSIWIIGGIIILLCGYIVYLLLTI